MKPELIIPVEICNYGGVLAIALALSLLVSSGLIAAAPQLKQKRISDTPVSSTEEARPSSKTAELAGPTPSSTTTARPGSSSMASPAGPSSSTSAGSVTGALPKRNWLLLLIGGLVVLCLPALLLSWRRAKHERVVTVKHAEEAEAHGRAPEGEQIRLEELCRQEEAETGSVEEEAHRHVAEDERRLAELEAVRKKVEEKVLARAEKVRQVRAEIEELRRAEEEQHTRFEAETQLRAEAEARLEQEGERRIVVEQARLSLEEAVRRQAEEEERRLAELEVVRQQVAEESRRRAEREQQLREEIEALRQAGEEHRWRIEEAEARKQAEEEASRQAGEEARLRAEEEESRRLAAEEARVKKEAEAGRRAEGQRKRLEQARVRAEQELQQVEEEGRRQGEEEHRRLAELEAIRHKAEEGARQRAEREQQLRAEIEALRQAEAEHRQRIAEREAERRVEEEARLRTEGQSQSVADEVPYLIGEPITELPSVAEGSTMEAPWVDLGTHKKDMLEILPLAGEFPAVGLVEITPDEEPAKRIEVVRSEKGIAQVDDGLSSVPSLILERLDSEDSRERGAALIALARMGGNDSFRLITKAFDDSSPDVRNAAARALHDLQPDRGASFTRALREGSPERRRRIGGALASSGLAGDAIDNLTRESRERTYDAFSLLFLMSKAGEVQPLMRAIEDHPNIEVRLAVVKLLALSGQHEVVPVFRRLAVRAALPSEVRSAVMEAIYQISSQPDKTVSSAA